MHLLKEEDAYRIESSWLATDQSVLQQKEDTKLELVLIMKEEWPTCSIKLTSTARTVEVFVDEEGSGKFAYLASKRGIPAAEHPGLFLVETVLPAGMKQAKLRLLSLTGEKSVCKLQGLECSTTSETQASPIPSTSSSGAGTAPQTQTAQIREALHAATHAEGKTDPSSAPPSLLQQKMAQAAASKGGVMAQLVQGMAEKALQQKSPHPPQPAEPPHASQLPGPLIAHEPVDQTYSVPAAVFEQWQARLQGVEDSVRALTSICGRLEAGQSAILQGQQAILARLDART